MFTTIATAQKVTETRPAGNMENDKLFCRRINGRCTGEQNYA
jgi:hypothetical protein